MNYLPCLCLIAINCFAGECLPRADQVDKPENIRFIVPDPMTLQGIVVDNTHAVLVGIWKHSIHTPPFVGISYIHDMKEKKGEKSVTFTPDLPWSGIYEVRVSHNSNIRRATKVPIRIRHAKGETIVLINEGDPAPIKKLFRSIGKFEFIKGQHGFVRFGTAGTEGKYVIVDSVQFIPVAELPAD
ncbi:MAG: xanthan lyase [Opitutae bacterium]|nr:xanthan lyase [Opitutae bacterium]